MTLESSHYYNIERPESEMNAVQLDPVMTGVDLEKIATWCNGKYDSVRMEITIADSEGDIKVATFSDYIIESRVSGTFGILPEWKFEKTFKKVPLTEEEHAERRKTSHKKFHGIMEDIRSKGESEKSDPDLKEIKAIVDEFENLTSVFELFSPSNPNKEYAMFTTREKAQEVADRSNRRRKEDAYKADILKKVKETPAEEMGELTFPSFQVYISSTKIDVRLLEVKERKVK